MSSLKLHDSNTDRQVGITAGKEFAGVAIADKQEARSALGVLPNGAPGLQLLNENVGVAFRIL